MVEYLGIVSDICTDRQLNDLAGVTTGTYVNSDPINLTWHKFIKNGAVYLVCNEFIKHTMKWNDLNVMGLVFGKDVTIGEKVYNLRVISGGDSDPSPLTIGGEWKEFMIDNNLGTGTSNLTICKETFTNSSTACIVVGYTGADNLTPRITYTQKDGSNQTICWKPMMVISKSFCNVSISTQYLGNIYTWTNKLYTITGDTFTLTEKLDSKTIRNLTDQSSGTEYTLDLSSKWNIISYGHHTIEIVATDSNGLSNTVTITFNKIKTPIQKLPVDANLEQVTAHKVEERKEMEYQLGRFKDSLASKGVNVAESDKFNDLINKINHIITEHHTTPIWAKLNNLWITASNAPSLLYDHAEAVVDEHIYIFKGPTTYRYNSLTNEWDSKSNSSTLNRSLSSTVRVDDKIYNIGGFTNTAIKTNECYDIITDTWSLKAEKPLGAYAFAACTIDKKIYCIGGNCSSYFTNVNQCYDTVTDTWTSKSILSANRAYLSSVSVDDVAYVIGGQSNSYDSSTVSNTECYDSITDTWSNKTFMSSAKSKFGLIYYDKMIFCMGGMGSGNATVVCVYDILTNKWSTRSAAMPTGRSRLTSSVINGSIYNIGGYTATAAMDLNEVYVI